jgi:hypothetical protein
VATILLDTQDAVAAEVAGQMFSIMIVQELLKSLEPLVLVAKMRRRP